MSNRNFFSIRHSCISFALASRIARLCSAPLLLLASFLAPMASSAAAAAAAPSTPIAPKPASSGRYGGDGADNNTFSLSQQSPFTPSGQPARPPTPPPIVSHIDLIVSNLSDGFCGGGDSGGESTANASSSAAGSAPGRKRSRADATSGTSSSTSAGGQCQPAPPPPGLESQYGELRRLLHRGLIGTSDEEGGDKRNVSALLMGPRGCGKSLVLERVLNDLRFVGGKPSIADGAESDAGGGGGDDDEDDGDDHDPHHYGMGRFFRIVRLNGLLLRGDDVGAAVREMVRQLSDVAVAEARYRQRVRRKRASAKKKKRRGTHSTGPGGVFQVDGDDDNDDADNKANNDDGDDDYAGSIAADLLRIRRQGFNSNLALLDETLRAARVDSMPVLVVLDELDAFLPTGGAGPAVGLPGGASLGGASGASGRGRMIGSRGPRGEMAGGSGPASSDRQLLLYHLLDRVADHRTLLSLIGMTSQLSTVGTFEKRVRSRAEGTSKIIYFGRPSSYEVLINMLSSKFDVNSRIEEEARKGCRRLGDQLKDIMQPTIRRRIIDVDEENEDARVRAMMKRNYQLGKDVRWFCRVLTVALSLLAEDCARSSPQNHKTADTLTTGDHAGRVDYDSSSTVPTLTSRYILEALMAMGGMVKTEEDAASAISMSSSGRSSLTSASRGGSTGSGGGAGSTPAYGPFDKNGRVFAQVGWDDPRIQELIDLPESQLAVLLSARRILCRDAAEDSSTPKPLTFGRIKREFETFHRGNVGSGLTTNLYEGDLLHFAFLHLMESGLICPAVDHTGGGPLQYYLHHTRTHAAMEPMALAKMPLHVLVDINSELGVLLKDKVLDCSTALREWGMRIN